MIARGIGAGPVIWGLFSTELGSPVGDTTGGTFRFTCTSTHAECTVTIRASVLSDSSTAPALFLPRILLYRGGDPDTGSEPALYCEFGDGPLQPIDREPLDENPSDGPDLPFNIGSSEDCNGPDPDPPPGEDVVRIVVPPGFYDVFTSFGFRATELPTP
jgi:hypothetical protein